MFLYADGPIFSLTTNASTDDALFTIDASTGALSFNAPPDFENPGDIGVDNVYDIEVQVEDGYGGVTTGTFQVTVNDVGEVAVLEISSSDPVDLGVANEEILVSQTMTVTNTGDVTATAISVAGIDNEVEWTFFHHARRDLGTWGEWIRHGELFPREPCPYRHPAGHARDHLRQRLGNGLSGDVPLCVEIV